MVDTFANYIYIMAFHTKGRNVFAKVLKLSTVVEKLQNSRCVPQIYTEHKYAMC